MDADRSEISTGSLAETSGMEIFSLMIMVQILFSDSSSSWESIFALFELPFKSSELLTRLFRSERRSGGIVANNAIFPSNSLSANATNVCQLSKTDYEPDERI